MVQVNFAITALKNLPCWSPSIAGERHTGPHFFAIYTLPRLYFRCAFWEGGGEGAQPVTLACPYSLDNHFENSAAFTVSAPPRRGPWPAYPPASPCGSPRLWPLSPERLVVEGGRLVEHRFRQRTVFCFGFRPIFPGPAHGNLQAAVQRSSYGAFALNLGGGRGRSPVMKRRWFSLVGFPQPLVSAIPPLAQRSARTSSSAPSVPGCGGFEPRSFF